MNRKEIQKRMKELQDSQETTNAFSKLVSGGKENYETVIDKAKEEEKCSNCDYILDGDEKFCPECGSKVNKDSNKEQ